MEDNFARMARYNKSWDFHHINLHLTKNNQIQSLVRERVGFEYFGFFIRHPLPVSAPALYDFNNYPSELVKLYYERQYWKIDPIINSAGDQEFMIWHKIIGKKSPLRELFGCYGDFRDGITYCFTQRDGAIAYISFAGEKTVTDAQAQAMCPDAYFICKMAVNLAAVEKKIKYEPRNEPLSYQELRILRFTADGMTAENIASKIFLAKSTIDFHIKNITRKMNCRNKTQAIAKAALMNLL
jgi:LuxR family transcriptional regulator